MSKPQLHSSHISMFTRCGEQYRRRYIEGQILPPGVALLIGTATHSAIEMEMKHKFETGLLLPDDQVTEAARDGLNSAWEERGCELTEEEKGRGVNVVKGGAVDTAIALAGVHHKVLAPNINPLHVERAWVVELDGFPYDLGGRIDLQEKPINTKVGRVRDTKTAGKSPGPNDAHGKQQLTVYATAVKVLDGEYPELSVDYLVKGKHPKAVTQETIRDAMDTDVLLRRIEAMCLALEKGVFLPASPEDWWCGPRFCGYADTCKYYRRGAK